jgi:hypothetical protein
MEVQPVAVFASFAIASQVILVAFFAARRWLPASADRYGWIAYGFGALGLAVGIWLAVIGESWRLWSGPILFAVWAAYGTWVDLLRRVDWRPTAQNISHQPIQWNVLGPFITLYLAAQMFLWWPLWDYWRAGWAVYLILFAANTALNIAGHFGPSARTTARVT